MDGVLSRLLAGGAVSGETLARELGVTRAAVWKQIESLREAGFAIESAGRSGYRLVSCPDSLLPDFVRHGLSTGWAGCEIEHYDSLPSTNRLARKRAAEGAPEGLLILAEEQTEGRGRRGRGWITPPGEAIAMSLLLRPSSHPSRVAALSLLTALATAEAIEEATGLPARVKWPNDIVIRGRKVVGILLEMDADEESVRSVVCGVGINVHQRDFPEELKETASSLDLLSGRTQSRAAVVRAFLARMEADLRLSGTEAFLSAYRARSATIGAEVRVISPEESFTGRARDVTESGSLLVETESGLREVLAGDVSVRGLMGYA